MSQSYFEKIFKNSNLDWKTIYLLPCIATADTTICVFQFKLLNNALFLTKILYWFGISQDSLCSFCSLEEDKYRKWRRRCKYSTVVTICKFFRKDLALYTKQFRPSISNITECHSWLHWLLIRKRQYYKSLTVNI